MRAEVVVVQWRAVEFAGASFTSHLSHECLHSLKSPRKMIHKGQQNRNKVKRNTRKKSERERVNTLCVQYFSYVILLFSHFVDPFSPPPSYSLPPPHRSSKRKESVDAIEICISSHSWIISFCGKQLALTCLTIYTAQLSTPVCIYLFLFSLPHSHSTAQRKFFLPFLHPLFSPSSYS